MTMQKTTLWLSGTDCLLMEVGEELLVAYAHGWEGYTKLPLPRYFEQIMGQLVKQCPWIGVTGYSTDFLVEEGLIKEIRDAQVFVREVDELNQALNRYSRERLKMEALFQETYTWVCKERDLVGWARIAGGPPYEEAIRRMELQIGKPRKQWE